MWAGLLLSETNPVEAGLQAYFGQNLRPSPKTLRNLSWKTNMFFINCPLCAQTLSVILLTFMATLQFLQLSKVTDRVGGRDSIWTQASQVPKSGLFILCFTLSHGKWERIECWYFRGHHCAWWSWSSFLRMSFSFWRILFQALQVHTSSPLFTEVAWTPCRGVGLLVVKRIGISLIFSYICLFIRVCLVEASSFAPPSSQGNCSTLFLLTSSLFVQGQQNQRYMMKRK